MPIKNMNSNMKSNTPSVNLPKMRLSKNGLIRFLLITVFLGALGSSGYFYYQYSQVKGANDIVDTKKTITAVHKLMNLPEGEVPTVATVTDKSKLKSEPFFQAAENGDKVLIFKSIKKAILYRPSTNKIVDVAPINTEALDKNAQKANTKTAVLGANDKAKEDENKKLTGTPTPPLTPDENKVYAVSLLNASGTQGATSTIESKAKGVEKIEIVSKDNAKKEYETSTIFVVNQAAMVQAKQLADELGYEISPNLPSGEEAPAGSDIVVIIGSNGL